MSTIEPGTEWTAPDNRGTCKFCGEEENGYAKQDAKGKWHPACWLCVKPKNPPAPMKPRKKIVTPPAEIIAEPVKQEKTIATDSSSPLHKGRTKLAPGMRPSVQRRKVRTNG